MKTNTAHTLGVICAALIVYLAVIVSATTQAAQGYTPRQQAELRALVEKSLAEAEDYHRNEKCSHDDWLCLLAYADVTRGTK